MLTVKKFRRGQGAPVFVEGGACAMAQWHNGQSKPAVITVGRARLLLLTSKTTIIMSPKTIRF